MRRRHRYPELPALAEIPTPAKARLHLNRLETLRSQTQANLALENRVSKDATDFLELAPKVADALDQLSQAMFRDTADILARNLTEWLQEVLEQPIELKVKTDYKRGSATVEFVIIRDGQEEDALRAQGGSVVNILSVGLRIIALQMMSSSQSETHRKFLVLDEPDAWLRPDLVPRLVAIIKHAGEKLGFQTILISHHELSLLEPFADKIYRFEPQVDGTVKVFGPSLGTAVSGKMS
ncbi:MAG: hypothetical protein ABL949_02390 [Fimbriimonadaceae bacterium]